MEPFPGQRLRVAGVGLGPPQVVEREDRQPHRHLRLEKVQVGRALDEANALAGTEAGGAGGRKQRTHRDVRVDARHRVVLDHFDGRKSAAGETPKMIQDRELGQRPRFGDFERRLPLAQKCKGADGAGAGNRSLALVNGYGAVLHLLAARDKAPSGTLAPQLML